MRNVLSFFPTQVVRNELPGWVDKTKEVIEKKFQKNLFTQPGHVLQTENILDENELNFLYDYVLEEARYFLSEQGYIVSKVNFYIKELWGQLFRPGGFNYPHIHPRCQISGLYFLSVPTGTFDVFINDPRQGKLMCDLDVNDTEILKPASSIVRLNEVQPGTFLMYNSWLTHSINNSDSEKNAYFLHYNIACE